MTAWLLADVATHGRADRSDVGVAILGCCMGLVELAAGIAIRRGNPLGIRKQTIQTYRWGVDRFRRNTSFALIPGGVWFLFGGVAFMRDWPAWFQDPLVVLTLAGIGLQLWITLRLPRWAVPDWVRWEEANGYPCLLQSPSRPRGARAVLRVLVVIALLAAMVAGLVAVTAGASTAAVIGPGLMDLGGLFACRAERARQRQWEREREQGAAETTGSDARGRPPARHGTRRDPADAWDETERSGRR